jgi:hypothetical protein
MMEQEEAQVIGYMGDGSMPVIVWIPIGKLVSRRPQHLLG